MAELNPLPAVQGAGRWLADWLVRAPLQFQPSIFFAAILFILWFLLVRRGLAQTWHFSVRLASATVERLIGVVLLVEYLATSRRRQNGRRPAQWAYILSGPMDSMLNVAARSYEKHLKQPSQRRGRLPLKTIIAVFLILTVPWYVQPHLPVGNGLRGKIADAYGKWDSFVGYLQGTPTISISNPPPPVFRPTVTRQADGSVLLDLGTGHARQRVLVFAGTVSSVRPKTQPVAIATLNNLGVARIRPASSVRRYFAKKLPISCIAGGSVLHLIMA